MAATTMAVRPRGLVSLLTGGGIARSELLIRFCVVKGLRYSTTRATEVSKLGGSGRYVNEAAKEEGVTKYYCNRNPRSLELLGMAEKPKGFQTARRRVDYYHRLIYIASSRHSTAFVNHNNGTEVVSASTTELGIARHLYKTSDVAAAYNIGRVVAMRCKEMGLYRVMWEHKEDRKHKRVQAFLSGVKEQGLLLNEPKVRNSMPPHGKLPK